MALGYNSADTSDGLNVNDDNGSNDNRHCTSQYKRTFPMQQCNKWRDMGTMMLPFASGRHMAAGSDPNRSQVKLRRHNKAYLALGGMRPWRDRRQCWPSACQWGYSTRIN